MQFQNILTVYKPKKCSDVRAYAKNEPVCFKNMVDNWPAVKKWDLDYFSRLGNRTLVDITFGNPEKNRTELKNILLSKYIEEYVKKGCIEEEKPYLAQSNLFKVFPKIKEDINFDEMLPFANFNSKFIWIGYEGTVTGLHSDNYNNFLAQIYGRKTLRLVSPENDNSIYISEKYDYGARLSKVDLFNLDLGSHPKLKNLKIYEITLDPGDLIYIPKDWWHQVVSLDKTISAACFHYNFKHVFSPGIRDISMYVMHIMGIYRRKNCTCHSNS